MKQAFHFLFVSILLFFGLWMVVEAEDIVSCNYDYSIGSAKIPFEFRVARDGSVSYSIPSGDYYKDSNGTDHFIHYKNFNSYSNALYNNGKISNACPRLAFGRDDKNTIWVYYGRDSSSLEEMGFFDSATLTGTMKTLVTDVTVDDRKEKEYCTLSKDLATNSPIYVRFYDSIEGEHMFEVSSYKNPNIKNRERYDRMTTLTIGTTTYMVSLDSNWNNISTFYSDSCKNSKIYLNAPSGDIQNFYITSEKPDPSNNASDLGSDKDDGSSYSKDDYDKPDEETDRKELNYDLNLKRYCNEGNVARTLKFIGIMLFLAKIFVPALIIILGSIDFGKAILAGKDDEVKKKVPILLKRVGAGIIIFFIPTIIDFLFSVLDGYSDTMNQYRNCHTCLLNPDQCDVSK